METNPRSQVTEWAPPPPVVSGRDKRPTPPPLPVPKRPVSAEAAFEATLDSLVDHFAALPPPEYGEPPELAPSPQQRGPARSFLAWGLGSLALGAVLVGGGVAGLHMLHRRPTVTPQPSQHEVPISVRVTPIEVKVAPLPTEPPADKSAPTATALPDSDEAEAAPAAAPAEPPRVAKKVAHHHPSAKARPAVAHHARAATGSDDGSWEDPYK